MSDRYIITFGFIPKNCTSSRIICGDESESGTTERTVIYEDGQFSCMELDDKTFKGNNPSDSSTHRELSEKIADAFLTALNNGDAAPAEIVLNALSHFLGDGANPSKVRVVAGEDDCGEFANSKGRHNGKNFVRYVYEEDGEVSYEEVVVLS